MLINNNLHNFFSFKDKFRLNVQIYNKYQKALKR